MCVCVIYVQAAKAAAAIAASIPPLDDFPLAELEAASKLLAAEVSRRLSFSAACLSHLAFLMRPCMHPNLTCAMSFPMALCLRRMHP